MRRHAQRGSSLPEMALAIGSLLALIFGIIDFGRALYTYQFVAQMAREGARWAMVRGSGCTALLDECNATASQITAYVQSLGEGATNVANLTVVPTWPNSTNAPGNPVNVQVTYTFKFLGVLPGVQIPMTSSSQMVISQ